MGVVIALFAICLGVYVATLSHKLDQTKSELEEAQALNVRMQSEVTAIRDDMIRTRNADLVYYERIDRAEHEYQDKIQTLEKDKLACDWLDDVLPDGVRNSIGICGRENHSTAGTPFDGMREAESGSDGD